MQGMGQILPAGKPAAELNRSIKNRPLLKGPAQISPLPAERNVDASEGGPAS